MKAEGRNIDSAGDSLEFLLTMHFISEEPEFTELFDGRLDFTEASIASLDVIISNDGREAPPHLEDKVELFGYYFGETVCRRLRWHWTWDRSGQLFIEAPSVCARVDPFAQVALRYQNGGASSLEVFFRALGDLSRSTTLVPAS